MAKLTKVRDLIATRAELVMAMTSAGLIERQLITWVKDAFVLGHAHYNWQTEPCFYACKAGESPEFYGDRTSTTAWTVNPMARADGRVVSIGKGLRISNGKGAEIFVAARYPKQKKLRMLRLQPDDKLTMTTDSDTSDLWQVARDSNESLHPTMKPAELAVRAIRNSSLPGQIVLDPFGGAGFTMIGCQQTKRTCYTMEIEPAFAAVILERMSRMDLQPELIKKPALAAHGK